MTITCGGLRFVRPEVDPHGTEGLRLVARAGGTLEDVLPPGHLEVLESRGHDRGLQLRFEQGSRDSAGPEVDVSFRSFRDDPGDRDVRDLQSASWP